MDDFIQDLKDRIETLEGVFEDLVSIQVKAAEYGVRFADVNMYKEIVKLSDLIMQLRYRQRQLEIRWQLQEPAAPGSQMRLWNEDERREDYKCERN